MGVETHRERGRVEKHHIQSVAEQIKELIPTLEEVSGNKFDMDRFKEAVRLSRECTDLWKAVLETASAVPSPLTFFDATIVMGPAVVARGTQEAVDYYKELLAELKERIARKSRRGGRRTSPALLGRHARLGQAAESFRAVYAAEDLRCGVHLLQQLDLRRPSTPTEPFESMARPTPSCSSCATRRSRNSTSRAVKDSFKFDGIVFHDAKTCPNNSNNRYGMPQRLAE